MHVPQNPKLARQAIFGLADGMMSILGVVLYLSGHPALIFPAALMGGVSAAVSMGAGEWMSEERSSFSGPLMMSVATLAGSVIPAIPYAFLHGRTAIGVSLTLCAIVALTVARLRSWRKHPYAETLAVLGVVLMAVFLLGLITPGAPG